MSDSRRTALDHAANEQRQSAYYGRRETIKDAVELCSKALQQGTPTHYEYIGVRLRDTILPALETHTDTAFAAYDSVLTTHDHWDWVAFSRFVDRPTAFIDQVTTPDDDVTTIIDGYQDRQTAAKLTIKKALESVVAICEHEGILMEDYANKVAAVGFHGKVGDHLQDAEMDLGDPVRIVTDQSGSLKTLYCGGTGQGKSTALETEAEDYYHCTRDPDYRNYKLIDLVGFRDGENWFADIPQHDDDLRNIRTDQGLPADFTDDEDRTIEILAPLTPGLSEENLPYDTDSDEFRVQPFTVPASEIRKPLLVSMISSKLTPQQETIIRSAYDDVNRRKNDWALRDLVEEIKTRDELGPDKKAPVIGTLRSLQNQGFIRTRDDDHTIDWRELFLDADTITVFTQAFVKTNGERDLIAQLIAFGYLANTVVQRREQMHDIPECVLLMRELWKVAPHSRRQAFDGRASSLQEAIGNMLSRLFRENRHSGIHVLADTQQPGDLLKPVREMFNRYVVFQVNKDTTKDIFEWTANNKWQSFYNTLTATPGEASVVGMVEPAIEERNIEYIGPIQYAPPSHHHRMERIDSTGWHARTKYLDHEELRRPLTVEGVDWDDEVPTELRIESGQPADTGRPDPEVAPVAAFADQCLRYSRHSGVQREKVRTAFNAFAADHDRGTWDFSEQGQMSTFGQRLADVFDDGLGETRIDTERAYKHVELTSIGREYLDTALEGLESSGEPIRTDD